MISAISNELEKILPQCQKIKGFSLSPGLSIGKIYFHNNKKSSKKKFIALSEPQKLTLALEHLSDRIEKQTQALSNKDLLSLWKTHHALSKDKGWKSRLLIHLGKGLNAEQAIEQTLADITALFSTKPFWKTRIVDWQALSRQLLDCMNNLENYKLELEVDKPFILIADDLSPGDLLMYPETHLAGIILGDVSPLSHLAIIARSLNVPIISGISHVEAAQIDGKIVILNGYTGDISILPTGYEEKCFSRLPSPIDANNKLSQVHPMTKDGKEISLYLNVSFSSELKPLKEVFYSGVGLCRTEFLFMTNNELPDIDKQANAYADILKEAGDRPVYFRAIDIGSDKKLPYFQMKDDINPALGWRSIRLYEENDTLFSDQIKALIQASHEKELYILLPMIAERREYIALKKKILQISEMMAEKNFIPTFIKIGITVEVPSIILQLEAFANEIDFISLGTNDLHQFYFAADRLDALLSSRYDRLSRSFLILLRRVLRSAREINIPINVCGEMVNYPEEALCILGVGYESLSLSPHMLLKFKEVLPNIDLQDLRLHMTGWLSTKADNVRPMIHEYLRLNNVPGFEG